jgi:hypothetical protein
MVYCPNLPFTAFKLMVVLPVPACVLPAVTPTCWCGEWT